MLILFDSNVNISMKGVKEMKEMTLKEFAEYMGVSPSTVRYWIRTKQIKAKITPYGYLIDSEREKEKIKNRRTR